MTDAALLALWDEAGRNVHVSNVRFKVETNVASARAWCQAREFKHLIGNRMNFDDAVRRLVALRDGP